MIGICLGEVRDLSVILNSTVMLTMIFDEDFDDGLDEDEQHHDEQDDDEQHGDLVVRGARDDHDAKVDGWDDLSDLG